MHCSFSRSSTRLEISPKAPCYNREAKLFFKLSKYTSGIFNATLVLLQRNNAPDWVLILYLASIPAVRYLTKTFLSIKKQYIQ